MQFSTIVEVFVLLCVAATCVCGQGCTSGFQAGPTCGQYKQCVHGQWMVRDCPSGLYWNNDGQYCGYPANSGCSGNGATAAAPAPQPQSSGSTVNQGQGRQASSGACTSGFQPGPTCNQYSQCVNGQWMVRDCPSGLEWNNSGQYCDYPASSGCSGGGGTGTTASPAPSPTSTSSPVTTTQGSSGDALISQSEFNAAAATKGGSPDVSYYNGFINSLFEAGISTRLEAAKYLAHTCWETVGYQYTKEQYCQTNMAACASAYPNNAGGLPGKVYYGRGMLQLTWDYNYKAASESLYGDDRLIQNPDPVADDPAIGWLTAAWFWITNVHAVAGTFGGTLKAINGALECDGGPNSQNMMLRFNHYKQILTILNLPIPPDSDGYCHA